MKTRTALRLCRLLGGGKRCLPSALPFRKATPKKTEIVFLPLGKPKAFRTGTPQSHPLRPGSHLDAGSRALTVAHTLQNVQGATVQKPNAVPFVPKASPFPRREKCQ